MRQKCLCPSIDYKGSLDGEIICQHLSQKCLNMDRREWHWLSGSFILWIGEEMRSGLPGAAGTQQRAVSGRAGKLLMLTQGTQRLVLLDTGSFPFHPELRILCVHWVLWVLTLLDKWQLTKPKGALNKRAPKLAGVSVQILGSAGVSGAGSYAFSSVWSENINVKCFTKKKKKEKSSLCQCAKTSTMCQLRKFSFLWGKEQPLSLR